MTAEIHFCDLCNESVPQSDLDAGKAFLRKGRVVCRRCDALMSHADPRTGAAPKDAGGPPTGAAQFGAAQFGAAQFGGTERATPGLAAAAAVASAGSAPGSTWSSGGPFSGAHAPTHEAPPAAHHAPPIHVATHTHHGAAAHQAYQPRSRGTAAGALAFLALVGAGLAWWWARGEVLRLDQAHETQRSDLQIELSALRSQIDAASRTQREWVDRTLGDVDRKLTEQRDALQKGIGASEQLSRASSDRLLEFERRLDSVKETVGTIGRHDSELVLLQQKLAQFQAALDDVEKRTGELARPQATFTPSNSGASAPPAWHAQLKDLQSPDAGARWQAVVALGETRDAAVVPHLVSMLKDSDLFVKMATARKLGELGSLEAVPALIDTLEDPESGVRSAALAALSALTKKDFGFDPASPDENERSKRVKAWRDWWAKEASKSAP